MFGFIRFILFCFPAETSHQLGLKGLKIVHKLGLSGLLKAKNIDHPCEAFGLKFANPVGLAAGLDKNADYIDALGALGFGFIEVGTVTPVGQGGNPKPRLFRLTQQQAIINRMGFNNKGVDHLVGCLKRKTFKGIVGVNIGKNFSTPVENALDDYLICLRKVYAYADYIVVNLSSPNTPGLRSLQFGEQLDELLASLQKEKKQLQQANNKNVPVLVKIAPDLSDDEIAQIADSFIRFELDGVIATNTTVERAGVMGAKWANEAGGLSGKPLVAQANHVLKTLNEKLEGKIPLIGVGGITQAIDAKARIENGAKLLQIYSGFIYQGANLIDVAMQGIEAAHKEENREAN